MSTPEITIDELVTIRGAGLHPLLDVRQPDEYEAGHVPGARSIPLSDVVVRIAEVPVEGLVYVICQSGGRSQKAVDYFRSLGIDAVNVTGGTKAWIESGHDVAYGPLAGDPS